MPMTRIAPTPSGFLHAGNHRNFVITADLARDQGATLALRIDDADAPRYRREYVIDIFDTLQELAISWDVGPRDADDFEANWSQQHRTEYYRDELAGAIAHGLPTYACACSRARQAGPAHGGCVGGCRTRHLPLEVGTTTLRVIVETGTLVTVGDTQVDVARMMGDFVIWRRDDLPAYQLVSLVEDRDLGVTHIVRGVDLLASSAAQIYLAPWLGAGNVAEATYTHHGLVMDASGKKLSKSTLAREEGAP